MNTQVGTSTWCTTRSGAIALLIQLGSDARNAGFKCVGEPRNENKIVVGPEAWFCQSNQANHAQKDGIPAALQAATSVASDIASMIENFHK